MLEILLDQTLSLIKLAILIGGSLLIISYIITASRKRKDKIFVEITDVSEELHEQQFDFMQATGLVSAQANYKYIQKQEGKKLFILDFFGSVSAFEVHNFKNEISALLNIATPGKDEVLIKINSGGGAVNGYGLVASQIDRLKKSGIYTICAIDEVAASGGYMAACVADRIIAAPFAYVGSIGVVASFPNFKNVMDKIGIEFKEYTAGSSKRTVSQYRTVTEEQEKEFVLELEETHEQFIKHVMTNRGMNTKSDHIFSGKCWLATEALQLKLVDEIMTSDEYIQDHFSKNESGAIFEISTHTPKDKSRLFEKLVKVAVNQFIDRLHKKQLY